MEVPQRRLRGSRCASLRAGSAISGLSANRDRAPVHRSRTQQAPHLLPDRERVRRYHPMTVSAARRSGTFSSCFDTRPERFRQYGSRVVDTVTAFSASLLPCRPRSFPVAAFSKRASTVYLLSQQPGSQQGRLHNRRRQLEGYYGAGRLQSGISRRATRTRVSGVPTRQP